MGSNVSPSNVVDNFSWTAPNDGNALCFDLRRFILEKPPVETLSRVKEYMNVDGRVSEFYLPLFRAADSSGVYTISETRKAGVSCSGPVDTGVSTAALTRIARMEQEHSRLLLLSLAAAPTTLALATLLDPKPLVPTRLADVIQDAREKKPAHDGCYFQPSQRSPNSVAGLLAGSHFVVGAGPEEARLRRGGLLRRAPFASLDGSSKERSQHHSACRTTTATAADRSRQTPSGHATRALPLRGAPLGEVPLSRRLQARRLSSSGARRRRLSSSGARCRRLSSSGARCRRLSSSGARRRRLSSSGLLRRPSWHPLR